MKGGTVSDDTGPFDEDETELDHAELDIEAPEADAVEQHLDVRQQHDLPVTGRSEEADPADAAEQSRVVELDEDDYR
jgi:hypothetical protein